MAHLVIKTLTKDRSDEKLELFWPNLMNTKPVLNVADTKLPLK